MSIPNAGTLWTNTSERIQHQLYYGRDLPRVAYTGTTTGNTPTELFLFGETDQRLVPPGDCLLYLEFFSMGRQNAANVNAAHHISRSYISCIRYGTTLEAEGANAATDVATTGNPATQAIFGTASHVAFTLDNTNDRIVCTVTGVAATEINWRIELVKAVCLPYPLVPYNGQLN